jgi:hypothetical protein
MFAPDLVEVFCKNHLGAIYRDEFDGDATDGTLTDGAPVAGDVAAADGDPEARNPAGAPPGPPRAEGTLPGAAMTRPR